MSEWWQFDKYGRKGALARLEATIDALHLLALKAPRPPAPPPPPAEPEVEVEKPKLTLPEPTRLPRAATLSKSVDRHRRGQQYPLHHRIGDEEGDAEAAVPARSLEDEVFDDRPYTQFNQVQRVTGELQMQREELVYGRTNIHLLVEGALGGGITRSLVEEGFYDPDRPDVNAWNMDKLVARLTREDRKQLVFFEGADKHIKMEGYPIHESIMRSANTEFYHAEPLLHTRIHAPAPFTGMDHWYDFRIQLNWVQFTEHALFSREDKLCRELEEMFAEYKRREAINVGVHYDSRLKALRSMLNGQLNEAAAWERKQLLMNPDSSALDRGTVVDFQQKQLDTLLLIRECIDQRDRDEYEQRTLFRQMYSKWMDIRLTRSEITREMKMKGFWHNELQPVPQSARGEAPSAPLSPMAAAPAPPATVAAGAAPSPATAPTPAASPSALLTTQQFAAAPLADNAAAAQQAQRVEAAQSAAAAQPFVPPPPPPPNPPEVPAPAAQPQQQQQPAYDAASMESYMAAQQQYQMMLMMQQQQQAAMAAAAPSTDPAVLQQQQQQQAMLLYQQQLAVYQQQVAQQQQLAQQQQPLIPSQPLPAAAPAAVTAPVTLHVDPGTSTKKGRHITIQETLQQEQARIEREKQEKLAADRLSMSGSLGASHGGGDDLLSTRTRADLGMSLERRSGLLKETYIGYPSNFKVGRMQCDWKHNAEDKQTYMREKAAWVDHIKAEIKEEKMRAKLQRCVANLGVDPTPPLTLEEEHKRDQELFEQIEERLSRMRRRPGGIKYLPVYNEELRVFDTSRCLLEEQIRRRSIDNYKIFLRVFVNGMRVCDTDPQVVTFPKFKVHFDKSLPLRLVAMPASITIQIFHATGLLSLDQPLAELGLPVPEFGAPASVQQYSFSGVHIDPETAALRHVPTQQQPFPPNRYMSGLMEASVYWGKETQDAPEQLSDLLREFQHNDRPRLAMRNRMADYMSSGGAGGIKLDPNDPRNADMLEYMHKIKAARGLGKKRSFVATESHTEGRLTKVKFFQRSARSLVLAARNDSGFIRDPVPFKDEDISTNLFTYISIRDEATESEWEKYQATVNPLDTEALYEREQLRAQAKILSVAHDVYDVAEVVNEQELPVFAVNLDWVNALFRPRRELRPQREAHKAVSAPKSCNIVIQIVKGQNLPVRKADGGTRMVAKAREGAVLGNTSTMPLEQQENVRTFIEVSLQDTCKRTSCARGTNPRWDQLISLPFRPPAQSFSPAHLSCCTDELAFNVFDEITHSSELDPNLVRTRVVHNEQRYLGSFTIPFTTIYQNGHIEGAFNLHVPPHLLGYEQPNPDRESVLFIYATMDPLLATPPERPDRFQFMNPFYARAIKWVNDLKGKSKMMGKRNIMAVAGDISSQPQFICRYIAPERPPDKYQQPNVFTRFVATIPFREDAQASLGQVKDIWCTSREFLALQGGDWEEHAILLCNYFTWYDSNLADSMSRQQNFVCLGDGFPEGDTAYVLRLGVNPGPGQSRVVINAVTGRSYDLNNPVQRAACPLQTVTCLFNGDNIWANLQENSDPTSCLYDLYNPQHWAPFFNTMFNKESAAQQYAMKFDTLQKPIHYTEESFEWYVDRAGKIERMVERRFEKWRSQVTHWDYGVCKVLRDALLAFEAHAQGEEVAINMDRPIAALRNAYGSLYGFPLHFSDSGDRRLLESTDENEIVAAVRNTKIHENEDPRAVFALAVYIHPYPNRMGSVWLYVACLSEK